MHSFRSRQNKKKGVRRGCVQCSTDGGFFVLQISVFLLSISRINLLFTLCVRVEYYVFEKSFAYSFESKSPHRSVWGECPATQFLLLILVDFRFRRTDSYQIKSIICNKVMLFSYVVVYTATFIVSCRSAEHNPCGTNDYGKQRRII